MRFFIILVSAILASGFAHTQDIQQRLHEYMSTLAEQEKFSGSVLVSKEGKVLLSQGYGMANYEFDIPNTPETKFRLASVSKQFTAMAIMQLREQGLLQLDDKISHYLPGYPHGDEITIHHLLTHTSGIAEISTLDNFVGESIKAHSLEQAVQFFKHAPLNFPPGQKYSYSNSGYILLSYLVQIISQDTFENFLTHNIFGPLDMHNSGHDNNTAIIKNRASGYNIAGDKMYNADYIHMSFPSGAGALYSTVEDLFKWDQALNGHSIFSKVLLAEIFKSQVSMDEVGGYGYGWVIYELNNRKVIFHNGGINGFSSNICRLVDDGVSIIILSNIEGLGIFHLTMTLAAIVLGEPL